MGGFRELRVWQKSKSLAVEIYNLTSRGAFPGDFGLRDQIRRAAVSVPSNIAEGDERNSNKDAVRFLYIAKGSLAELVTQLEIAHEIGYLSKEELCALDEKCSEIGRMLGSLIKARTQNL
jgi:four helix bundle protein